MVSVATGTGRRARTAPGARRVTKPPAIATGGTFGETANETGQLSASPTLRDMTSLTPSRSDWHRSAIVRALEEAPPGMSVMSSLPQLSRQTLDRASTDRKGHRPGSPRRRISAAPTYSGSSWSATTITRGRVRGIKLCGGPGGAGGRGTASRTGRRGRGDDETLQKGADAASRNLLAAVRRPRPVL